MVVRTVIVTGSAGLVGSEAATFFAEQGFDVVGIDNNMRAAFFGEEASTRWRLAELQRSLGDGYRHHDCDIRDKEAVNSVFSAQADICLVIHCAAQPSHDWAARDPQTDFSVNANGTLNLLEATRTVAAKAVFIFTSTNKVYGDRPNQLPLIEDEMRWEIAPDHTYVDGIREDMSIDQSLHSLFGASKVAADVLVQEYGRYFGMYTGVFRGGCLTGPKHSGTQLHGFLAYLMRCAATGEPYTIFGYKGKQVRDCLHSMDLVRMFQEFFEAPRVGEVYNAGGGRASNCSMLEAIAICEEITGKQVRYKYSDVNRVGDHIWYVSSVAKFQAHYPGWRMRYDVRGILEEIYEINRHRWADTVVGLSPQASYGGLSRPAR
jgi:CDP-paratose 2-epimerase